MKFYEIRFSFEELNHHCWYCGNEMSIHSGIRTSFSLECDICNIKYHFDPYYNSSKCDEGMIVFYSISIMRSDINVFAYHSGIIILQLNSSQIEYQRQSTFSINDKMALPDYYAFSHPIDKVIETIRMMISFI